jgi:hypothetical protein
MLDSLGGESRWQTSCGVHTQQVTHIGGSRYQGGAEGGKPLLDFVPDILVPVAGVNLELLLEQLNDGPIGQGRAVGMTATVEPGAVVAGEGLATFIEQAGFPQPRIADNRHCLPASTPCQLKTLVQ